MRSLELSINPTLNLSIEHLHRFFQHCLNLLFPPTCVGCQRMGTIFCSTCAQSVEPVLSKECSCCQKIQIQSTDTCPACRSEDSFSLIDLGSVAAFYTHPLRSAIHALKYDNCREIAPFLARYLAATFIKSGWQNLPSPIDAVVPIPTHPNRKIERGYNQAELLAAEFCHHTRLAFQPKWVERPNYTRSQVGLTPKERRENVQNAFRALSYVEGRTILLIDDLYTTGATLNACAAAIKEAGGQTVYTLALAKPIPHES